MFGRDHRPSGPAVTRAVAEASPTRRATSTEAPPTEPPDPPTVPDSVACPGPMTTPGIVVRPDTGANAIPVKSGLVVVDWFGDVAGGGGRALTAPGAQPASPRAAMASSGVRPSLMPRGAGPP